MVCRVSPVRRAISLTLTSCRASQSSSAVFGFVGAFMGAKYGKGCQSVKPRLQQTAPRSNA